MIQYEKGSANRLGDRNKNEDRGLFMEKDGALLLIVADGMGGHEGGELASQEVVNCYQENFEEQNIPIHDPPKFLEMVMREAHYNLSRIGSDEDPPFYPRTTCVACLIQGNEAYWAHLGDSRLYLLREGEIITRTRDHTYIEELFQNQVISEEEMLSHPMRNYVTYCLGGPNELPPVSIGHEILAAGDLILLCSDGLWGALNVEDIEKLNGLPLDTAVNRLAEQAEQISHPRSDNITAVGIRIESLDASQDGSIASVRETVGQNPGISPRPPVSRVVSFLRRALGVSKAEAKSK